MNTDMITSFITNYGWQLALVALAGILFIGILKHFDAFNKVKKEYRKFIYYPVSCAIAVLACVAYMFAAQYEQAIKMSALGWVYLCLAVMGYSVALYAFYENTGLRNLFQSFGNAVLKNIKKIWDLLIKAVTSKTISTEKLKEELFKLGSNVIKDFLAECEQQEAAQKAEQEATQNTEEVQNTESTLLQQTIDKYPTIFKKED